MLRRLVVLATSSMLLAACGLVGVGTSADNQVTFWHAFTGGAEGAGINRIVKDFNERAEDYSVKQRPISNEEHFTVVRTGLAGNSPPDVVAFEGYQQTRDFAKAGQLQDLTSFWDEHSEDFILDESAERACTYEGKVYCIPYTFHTGWQLYYNADLLAEHDVEPPTTYDEFLAAADKLKNAGVTPIAIGAKDGWPATHWWMAFLVQRCGVEHVYDAIEGSGGKFTDPCFVAASEDLAQLADKDYFSSGAVSDDYGASLGVFRSEKAAFFQTGSWLAAGLLEDPTDFETGIVPFPRLADDEHPGDIIGAVTHVFGISADAKNPDGAMDFLEYLVSDRSTDIWARQGLLSLADGAVEQHGPDEILPLWDAVLEAETSLPWIENELPPGVGEDKVYNGTAALIAGRMDAREFTESIQTALEAER